MLTFKKLINDIELPIYLKTYFANIKIEQKELLMWSNKLTHMSSAPKAFESLSRRYKDTIYVFYVMLYSALETYNHYLEKGISYDIYIETMKAFTRFMVETKQKSGIYQFDRGFWIYRQLSAVLFRIGTLEYEITKLEDKDVISIHIPSDAILTKEELDVSLKDAKDFLMKYFKIKDYRYYCKSWLLSPRLEEVLPKNSKILIFQSFFEDYTFFEADLQCLYWVFGTRDKDFSKLKEETSLQKRLKDYLLSGKQIGSALAFIKPF